MLDQLFRTYHKEVYGYLYSLCRDASLSEDLTSEVFVEVLQSLGSFRGQSDIKTWLFSIARHRWFHYLRKKHKTVETELLTEFLESPDAPLEERALDSELADRIRKLAQAEPERSRRVFVLRMEGHSFHEIGGKLGISESSARVIYFRMKETIKKQLEKEGF